MPELQQNLLKDGENLKIFQILFLVNLTYVCAQVLNQKFILKNLELKTLNILVI